MSIIDVIIIGIVEGLTEFLPISSTGHLILLSHALQLENSTFLKTFEISIQLGAILAVVILYWKRLLKSWKIYYKLFWAFIPTAIAGFLAYDIIKSVLFNAYVVSVMLILGGIVLIFIDRWTEHLAGRVETLEDLSNTRAAQIGFFQILSMIPGTSRAAATIIGGMVVGYDRKQAAEFSFLLAIPTMAAATGYDLLQTATAFSAQEMNWLFIGGAVAFLVALAAIKGFVAFLVKYGFKHFGYYRIALGGLFLIVTWWAGLQL